MMEANCRFACLEDLITFIRSDLCRFLTLDEIESFLSQLTVSPNDFSSYVVQDQTHYHRERIVQTDFASLYILTWLPGQQSPIHDHRASRCGVRVLSGEMYEVFYELVPGTENKARRTGVGEWRPGIVTSAEEEVGIHKVVNETQDSTLVTLHLYSPPLSKMTIYTEDE